MQDLQVKMDNAIQPVKEAAGKKKKKKKRYLKREIQRRVKRNHCKMVKMHTNIMGEIPWLDKLKAWSQKNLSHTAQLVLQGMIKNGYRLPMLVDKAGRTSSAELCRIGVVVRVEEYILISKKSRILEIVKLQKQQEAID